MEAETENPFLPAETAAPETAPPPQQLEVTPVDVASLPPGPPAPETLQAAAAQVTPEAIAAEHIDSLGKPMSADPVEASVQAVQRRLAFVEESAGQAFAAMLQRIQDLEAQIEAHAQHVPFLQRLAKLYEGKL